MLAGTVNLGLYSVYPTVCSRGGPEHTHLIFCRLLILLLLLMENPYFSPLHTSHLSSSDAFLVSPQCILSVSLSFKL